MAVPAAQIREPAGIRWSGLRNQARQRQLQTRLKSTWRRATNAIRFGMRWATFTRSIVPWMSLARA